jgi:hypothetical protein
MAQKRKHKDNAARQQAYRDKKAAQLANVTASSRGTHKQPLANTSAVNAAAHGLAVGKRPRFLQRVDTHDDVLYVQSLAMADDDLKVGLLNELRTVAKALLPVQRAAHPNESPDRLWERALERAFEIINGVRAPKEGQ